MKYDKIILGALIALGLSVIGFCVNSGLQSFSNRERVVTVKGLAEKKIKATGSKISINYAFSGDVPQQIAERVENQTKAIVDYLAENGMKQSTVSDIDIYDSKTYYTYEWEDNKRIKVKTDRYRMSRSIDIELKDVENTEKTSKAIKIDLINKGLAVDIFNDYSFPELNSIKPEMIAESTKNARLAGEQFAQDSKSVLGKIKTASQGQISIAGRYYAGEEGINTAPTEPFMQKVRVVSTIVFYLED